MKLSVRPSIVLVGLALLPAVAIATGFGSDNPPSRIPVPARNFAATVEDHGGVVVEVERVTWNGEIFFYGTIGAAQVTVPFESVRSAAFKPSAAAGKREAIFTLRSGETVQIRVDDDTPCYGRTRFGNYAIEADQIRSIRFEESP